MKAEGWGRASGGGKVFEAERKACTETLWCAEGVSRSLVRLECESHCGESGGGKEELRDEMGGEQRPAMKGL